MHEVIENVIMKTVSVRALWAAVLSRTLHLKRSAVQQTWLTNDLKLVFCLHPNLLMKPELFQERNGPTFVLNLLSNSTGHAYSLQLPVLLSPPFRSIIFLYNSTLDLYR
jgi:hypothetical protein